MKKIFKTVSIFLTLILIFQDIGWASPNPSCSDNTLQPKSGLGGLQGEFERECAGRSVTGADEKIMADALDGVAPAVAEVAREALGLKVPDKNPGMPKRTKRFRNIFGGLVIGAMILINPIISAAETMAQLRPPVTREEVSDTKYDTPEERLRTAWAILFDMQPEIYEKYSSVPVGFDLNMTSGAATTNAGEIGKEPWIRVSIPWLEGRRDGKSKSALYLAMILRHEIQHLIDAGKVTNIFKWWYIKHKIILFGGEEKAFGEEWKLLETYDKKYKMEIDYSLYDEYDVIMDTLYHMNDFWWKILFFFVDIFLPVYLIYKVIKRIIKRRRDRANRILSVSRHKRHPHDSYICQGEESKKEFESKRSEIEKNDITAKYKDRIQGFNGKIYGFTSIVKRENDFFLGYYDAAQNKLYLAEDLIRELEESEVDEYLMHEILCARLGHYEAIEKQRKIFKDHYNSEKWVHYNEDVIGDKGIFKYRLRAFIDRRYISVLRGEALERTERDERFTIDDYGPITKDEVKFDRIHELRMRMWQVYNEVKEDPRAARLVKRIYEGLAQGYMEDKKYHESRVQEDLISLQILVSRVDWDRIESLIINIEDGYGLKEVKDINKELEFMGIIGLGRNAVVKKVRYKGAEYALKCSSNLIYRATDLMLYGEYKILQDLQDIKEVPRVYKNCRAKAILMELIEGKNLKDAGPQNEEFFTELERIAWVIFEKGYTVEDLRDEDIMVRTDGTPAIVDFAAYEKYSADERGRYKKGLRARLAELRGQYLKEGLCVTGDTVLPIIKVHSPQSIVHSRIIDVTPGDYVLSLNEETQQIEPHRINGLLDMGVKPVYKLTTASGRSIKTTANHPYLTRNGWIKASGLKEGDKIGVPNEYPLSTGNESYNFLYIIKRYYEMVKYIFSPKEIKSYSKTRREADSGIEGDISYFDLQEMKKHWDKAPIANRSKTLLAFLIINAYKFCILNTKYRIKSACVHVGVNSKPVISTHKFQRDNRTWYIFIAFIRKLYSTIRAHTKSLGYGTLIPKILALGCSAFAFSLNWEGVPPWYIFPSAATMYSPANVSTSFCIWCFSHLSISNTFAFGILYSPPSYSQLNYTTGIRKNQVQFRNKPNILFLKLSRLFSLPELEAAEISKGDLLWDRIVSIEYIGNEHVYDIEVEGTHNFIGNGIFAHNTYLKAPGSIGLDEDSGAKKYIESIVNNSANIDETIQKDNATIHTVKQGKLLLGIPRFSGAIRPQYLVYACGRKERDSKLHIYVTTAFWKILQENRIMLDFLIDRVREENMKVKTHGEILQRAWNEEFLEDGINPFYRFYLDQIAEEGQDSELQRFAENKHENDKDDRFMDYARLIKEEKTLLRTGISYIDYEDAARAIRTITEKKSVPIRKSTLAALENIILRTLDTLEKAPSDARLRLNSMFICESAAGAIRNIAEKKPLFTGESTLAVLERILLCSELSDIAYGFAARAIILIIQQMDPSAREKYLKKLLPLLKLRRIIFQDDGRSANTFSHFAEGVLTTIESRKTKPIPGNMPKYQYIGNMETLHSQENIDSLLGDYELAKDIPSAKDGALGRTLIYKHKREEKYLALKVLKKNENAGKLIYESEMLGYINDNKDSLGLIGRYPSPALKLFENNRVIRARELPCDALSALSGQTTKEGAELELDNRSGYYTLMAYETDSADYFTYLNDSTINEGKFKDAIDINMHDLFSLAKAGIINTALIELFHNAAGGRINGGEEYHWMVDIIRDASEPRFGAGRLHDWLGAVRYPNLRLSGLADFADTELLDNMVNNPSHLTVVKTRIENKESIKKVYLASFLGDYLLSMALIIGSRMREKKELDWENPEKVKELMKNVFNSAYEIFTDNDIDLEILEQGIDWDMLARQMAYFMSEAYIEDCGPSISLEEREEKVKRLKDKKIYRGDTDIGFGVYRAGSWLDKIGWIGFLRNGQPDNKPALGPVNGPMPLQELIKALYFYTAFMATDVHNKTEQPDGRCVTGDTILPIIKVHSPQSIVHSRIIDVKPGDYVLSLNEETQKIEPHRINGLLDMGVKPVYKLTTASGRSIKTTANHPYLTRNGWVKVSGLKKGSKIGVPRLDSFAPVGIFSLVNTVYDNSPPIHVKADTVLPGPETMCGWRDIYQWFCKRQWLAGHKKKFNFTCYTFLEFCGKFFKITLAGWGKFNFFGHLWNQFKPSLRLIFSKEMYPNLSASAIPFLSLDTNFGLTGRWDSMASISQPTGLCWTYSSSDTFSSYLVSKAQSKSQSEYVSNIKYFGDPSLSTTTPDLNFFGNASPFVLSSLGIFANLSINSNLTGSFADNFTKDVDFISHTPFANNYSIVHSLLSSLFSLSALEAAEIGGDIFWDRIVSIEYIGNEHVYDIEVEGTHNFIGNGIFAHNTAMKGIDLGNVSLDYIKKSSIFSEKIRVLINGLRDSYGDMRASSAEALGILKDKGLLPDTIVIGEEITSALVNGLGDIDGYMRAKSAEALGILIGKGLISDTNIIGKITSVLVNSLGDIDDYIRAKSAKALGILKDKGLLPAGIVIGEEITRGLINGLGDDGNWVMRASSAEALGILKDKGLLPDTIVIGKEITSALISGLGDGNWFMRARSAEALGILIGKGLITDTNIIGKITSALVNGLGDIDGYMRAKSAEALGILIGKGLISDTTVMREEIISALINGLRDSYGDMRAKSAKALGILKDKGLLPAIIVIGKEITSALISGLGDSNWVMRARSAEALDILKEKGLISDTTVMREEIISALIKGLGDRNWFMRAKSAEALGILIGRGLISDTNIIGKITSALISGLGDIDDNMRAKSAETLGILIDKGLLEVLPFSTVEHFYNNPEDLKPHNQNAEKISYIVMTMVYLKGDKITDECFKLLRDVIKGLDNNRDDYYKSLGMLLDTIVFLSINESNDAQVFLEGYIEGIYRKTKGEKGFIEITKEDELYINSILQSHKQNVLLSMVYREDIQPEIRVRIIKELAVRGVIDSGYGGSFFNSDRDKKLSIITDVYNKLKIISPVILVEKINSGEPTLDKIIESRKELERVLGLKDLRKELGELYNNPDLMLVYYCFYQAPFNYPGTSQMSYERFSNLIKAASQLLGNVEDSVLTDKFRNAMAGAGLGEETIEQIISNLIRGGPPLPNNSEYLDTEGRFKPQRIETDFAIRGTQVGDVLERFGHTKVKLGELIRINFLLQEISKGINRTGAEEMRGNFNNIKQKLQNGNYNWEQFEDVITELSDIYNALYTKQKVSLEQRLGDYERILVQKLLSAGHRHIFLPKGKGEVGFLNLDITRLDKRAKKAIQELEERRRENKITPGQARILGEGKIKINHLINLFFSSISADESLRQYLTELNNDMRTDYERYTQTSEGVSVYLPEVYVDYIDKRKLFEILRFSDGAHSCNSSDPKVSSAFVGISLYERDAPRWIVDNTTIFFQITTEPRVGKQIGWLKAWIGIDKEGKPFIGSNYLYLNPGYHDPRLRDAILNKITDIFASIKINRYAQAKCGYTPKNAISPPKKYRLTSMEGFMRLQTLRDGIDIQADVKFPPNTPANGEFYVHERTAGAGSQADSGKGLCVTGDTFLPIVSRLKPSVHEPVSGCQTGCQTLVWEHKPIVDVKPGDYVLSLNEETQKTEPHRINGLLDMGTKPVYKLTTASGRSIKTTANHPYLTKRGWIKVSGLNSWDEIAVPKIFGLSINFSSMPDFCYKNIVYFPIKYSTIIANLKTIGIYLTATNRFGKNQWVGLFEIMLYLANYSFLYVFWQFQKQSFRMAGKVIGSHLIPAFFFTTRPETRPDLRDLTRDAKNSGFEDSTSSSISSKICLPNINPIVFPFLSTRRTMPCNENGNLEIRDGSKKTTFSSDNPLNSGDIIYAPPILENNYNGLINRLSRLFSLSEIVAAEVGKGDILWDRITSIEYIGNEHVYDIEVEGTHNFIGNGIFAHNTAIMGNGNPSAALNAQGRVSRNYAPRHRAHRIGRGLRLRPRLRRYFSYAIMLLLLIVSAQCISLSSRGTERGISQEDEILFAQQSVSITRDNQGFYWNINGSNKSSILGINYNPIPVGQHPNDYNGINGAENFHELHKALLPAQEGGQGHAEELKRLGVEAIRVYGLGIRNIDDIERIKRLFRWLYETYGISVIVTDFCGLYTHPNDWRLNEQEFLKLVEAYGNEPWLLAFVLGNENNYYLEGARLADDIGWPLERRIRLNPETYYRRMAEIASNARTFMGRNPKPIGIGNGDFTDEELDAFANETNGFDFIGVNNYNNTDGIADLLERIGRQIPRLPVFFTEYGILESIQPTLEPELQGRTQSIYDNRAGHGSRNSIGGCFYEATDEAWKVHDTGQSWQAHLGILGKGVNPFRIRREQAQDNIGKGVKFIAHGNRLTIKKTGEEKPLAENLELKPVGVNLERIKKTARGLNVYKEFGDSFLEALDDIRVMVFDGTTESRAAGALAHMGRDRILYIDSVLLNNDMAIIHEAIHEYLKNIHIRELMRRINGIGAGEKIKKKANDACQDMPGTYVSFLNHYYARYYLQNPIKGDYEGSQNEQLTKEIRIAIFMNLFMNSIRKGNLDIQDNITIGKGRVLTYTDDLKVHTDSSEILGAAGCYSCAPIIVQTRDGENGFNHLVHYVLICDEYEGRELEISKREVDEYFGYVGEKDCTFIIPANEAYIKLYRNLSEYVLQRYPNSRVLLVPVPVGQVKTAIVMREGIGICAGRRGGGNTSIPEEGTAQSVYMTWEKIYSFFGENRSLSIKFEDLLTKAETSSPQKLHIKGIITIICFAIGCCMGFPGLGFALGLIIDFREWIIKTIRDILIGRRESAPRYTAGEILSLLQNPQNRLHRIGQGKNAEVFELEGHSDFVIKVPKKEFQDTYEEEYMRIKKSLGGIAVPMNLVRREDRGNIEFQADYGKCVTPYVIVQKRLSKIPTEKDLWEKAARKAVEIIERGFSNVDIFDESNWMYNPATNEVYLSDIIEFVQSFADGDVDEYDRYKRFIDKEKTEPMNLFITALGLRNLGLDLQRSFGSKKGKKCQVPDYLRIEISKNAELANRIVNGILSDDITVRSYHFLDITLHWEEIIDIFWDVVEGRSERERQIIYRRIALNYLSDDIRFIVGSGAELRDSYSIVHANFYPEIVREINNVLNDIRSRISEPRLDRFRRLFSKSYRESYNSDLRNYRVLMDHRDENPWKTLTRIHPSFQFSGEFLPHKIKNIEVVDGFTLFNLVNSYQSYFFRDEPLDFYENFRRRMRDLIEHRDATKKQIIRIGVIGSGFGQEPISIAITLSELLEEMDINRDAVDFEIHVFDRKTTAYEMLKDNTLFYPEEGLTGLSDELTKKYLLPVKNGYVRGKRINERMYFHNLDLLNPETFAPPDTKLDFLTIHNVTQYLRPEGHRRFETIMQEARDFMYKGLLRKDGVISIYSSVSVDKYVGRLFPDGTWSVPSDADHPEGLCVTEDTVLPIVKVHSPQSTVHSRIVDVKPGDYVLSLNEETQKIEPHRINGLLDMGVKPVYHLTTASGRSIKTTANHPYLTRNGWVKVSGLREGDAIGVPASDGLSSICTTTNFNTLNNNIFTTNIKRYTIIPDTETMGAWREIYQWFCANKRISQICIILQFFINAFLDIFWQRFKITFTSWGKLDFVHNRTYTNPSSRSTSLKGINPFFLASAIDLFKERTNLGLRGSKDSILSISQPAGFTDLLWYSSVDNLSTNVSSILESTSSRANVSKIKIWGTSSLPTITAALEPLLSLNTERGEIFSNGTSRADFSFIGKCFICSPPRKDINILFSKLSRLFTNEEAEASEMGKGDILWDRIVSIEYIGNEHVYDIEVEGTHNFIGNGIFAHNTYLKVPGKGKSAELSLEEFKDIIAETSPMDINPRQIYGIFSECGIRDSGEIMRGVKVYSSYGHPQTMNACGREIDGILHIIINADYIRYVCAYDQLDLALAEIIDHEYTEHIEKKSHRDAAQRQKQYFSKGRTRLTLYHDWVLCEMSVEQLKEIIDEYKGMNELEKAERGWDEYEKLFYDKADYIYELFNYTGIRERDFNAAFNKLIDLWKQERDEYALKLLRRYASSEDYYLRRDGIPSLYRAIEDNKSSTIFDFNKLMEQGYLEIEIAGLPFLFTVRESDPDKGVTGNLPPKIKRYAIDIFHVLGEQRQRLKMVAFHDLEVVILDELGQPGRHAFSYMRVDETSELLKLKTGARNYLISRGLLNSRQDEEKVFLRMREQSQTHTGAAFYINSQYREKWRLAYFLCATFIEIAIKEGKTRINILGFNNNSRKVGLNFIKPERRDGVIYKRENIGFDIPDDLESMPRKEGEKGGKFEIQRDKDGKVRFIAELPACERGADGYISQGRRSKLEFESKRDEIEKNEITKQYKDRLVNLVESVITSDSEAIPSGLLRSLRSLAMTISEDGFRIYGFNSIVKGENDFFLGKYDKDTNKLYLAEDLISLLEACGPLTLADEYLLHEVLCPILGHKQAIRVQQRIFDMHYPVKDVLSEQTEDKPYKGLLGKALRSLIDFESLTYNRILEYGLQRGVVKSDKQRTFNVLLEIFSGNGIERNTARRIAETLVKMNSGSLEILRVLGIITEEEEDFIIGGNADALKEYGEDKKKDLLQRFNRLIASYDGKLNGAQRMRMLKRLVPGEIIGYLTVRYSVSRITVLQIIDQHPDFLVWLPFAEKKVREIESEVGGRGNAWIIVKQYGLEGLDHRIKKAKDLVIELQGKGVSVSKAWNYFARNGLPNGERRSHTENIGKGVEYIVTDKGLRIVTKYGTADVSVDLADVDKERIKILAKTLNVYKEFKEGFIRLFDEIQIKVFDGTAVTRSAGAFAHMGGNRVLYIDSILLNNDMAIIHEAIHEYLKGVTEVDFMYRLSRTGVGEKIVKKAASEPKNYRPALRHYYARYYLQNSIDGGASDNRNLTYEIRLNMVANILGIEVAKLETLLSNLEINDLELRNLFLKLLKEDGEINEEEIKVLVRNIELVMKAITDLSGLISESEKREAIKRIALYLSIEDVRRSNMESTVPKCMRELADALSVKGDFKPEAIKIVSELRKKDIRAADLFLNKIAEEFGSGIQPYIAKVRKYLYLRLEVAEKLKVNPVKVSPIRDVAGIINGYLRDREGAERIVEPVTRYLSGEEFDKNTEPSLGRIKTIKQISADITLPRIDPSPISKFREGIGGITADSGGAVILQHVSVYLSGNPDWDRENIDSMIVDLVKEKRTMFIYDRDDEKDRFIKLLESKGINPETIICKRYEDIKSELQGRRVIKVIKEEDPRFRDEDTIVTGKDKVVDLYLMWNVTLLYAQYGRSPEFSRNIKSFFEKYYANSEFEDKIDNLAEGMFMNSVWIILPPVVPFIKDYFEALNNARNLINQSA